MLNYKCSLRGLTFEAVLEPWGTQLSSLHALLHRSVRLHPYEADAAMEFCRLIRLAHRRSSELGHPSLLTQVRVC